MWSDDSVNLEKYGDIELDCLQRQNEVSEFLNKVLIQDIRMISKLYLLKIWLTINKRTTVNKKFKIYKKNFALLS